MWDRDLWSEPRLVSCVFTAHQERGHPGRVSQGSQGQGTGAHRMELSRDLLLSLLPQTLESVDVHCFGHLLYEMTYGRPPDTVPVDSFPPAPSMAVGQYGVLAGVFRALVICRATSPFSRVQERPRGSCHAP